MKTKLLIGLSISLFTLSGVHAQNRTLEVHYGTDNDPSFMKNEVIVAFRPDYVNQETVNDTTVQYGRLQDFVQEEIVQALEEIFPDAGELETHKIFTRLRTDHSFSVTRSGDTIAIPQFWATLLLVLPAEMDEEEAAIQIAGSTDLIDYAERNYVAELHSGANDTKYPEQASLRPTAAYPDGHINVEEAWDMETGKAGIKVGVYDTGIDWRHEDFGDGTLNGSVIKGGYDYVSNVTLQNSLDLEGHGTKCAGIIGAIRNNNNTVAGIAGGDAAASKQGVSLYSMKVMDNYGYAAPVSAISNAIVDGATWTPTFGHGLHVMNNSWGFRSVDLHVNEYNTLRNAVNYAYNNHVVYVASRGNRGHLDNAVSYPACFSDKMVINVGASGANGEYKDQRNGPNGDTYSSSYGYGVDLVAPGTIALVQTTYNFTSGSTGFNGTSAAAPHVSGVAALMLSYYNNYNVSPNKILFPEDVEQILQRTAKDKHAYPSAIGYDDYSGWGLLDAGKALKAIDKVAYSINQGSTTTGIINTALHQQNVQVYVASNLGNSGLSAGYYIADIYKITKTITIPVGSLETLLDVWPLNQENVSNLISIANPVSMEPNAYIQSRNGQQVTFAGYVYKIKTTMTGANVTRWLPFDPNVTAGKIRYSVYKSTGAVSYDPGGGGSQGSMMAYPNPTPNNASLSYQLTQPAAMSLQLTNMTGTIVQSISEPLKPAGIYTLNLDLSALPAGMYMYQIIAGTQVFQGKISKL